MVPFYLSVETHAALWIPADSKSIIKKAFIYKAHSDWNHSPVNICFKSSFLFKITPCCIIPISLHHNTSVIILPYEFYHWLCYLFRIKEWMIVFMLCLKNDLLGSLICPLLLLLYFVYVLIVNILHFWYGGYGPY